MLPSCTQFDHSDAVFSSTLSRAWGVAKEPAIQSSKITWWKTANNSAPS